MEFFEAGETERAVELASALERTPATRHFALYLQSLIASRRGDEGLALERIRAAEAAKPAEPVYWLRAAELSFARGDANASAERYERLLALPGQPFVNDPHLLFAAAGAMERSGNNGRAMELLRRAIELRPEFPEARTHLAVLLQMEGKTADAREQMHHVLRTAPSPSARLKRALMLPLIYDSTADIDAARKDLSRELDDLLAEPRLEFRDPNRDIGMTAFPLAYHGRSDLDLMRKFASVVRRGYTAAAASLDRGFPRRRTPGGRLRVGFVSTHFHDHSIGKAFHGFIHDLPRERFETWVFALAPRADARAQTLRAAGEHYVAVADDVDVARAAIEAAGLDVLIFADLGMSPTTYFLAFWRMAPLQMVLWGHPVTSGIDSVDYFVSAAQLEPESAQAHYSEKLLRLDGYFLPRYARPTMQAAPRSRAELGISPRARVYHCPQTLFKMHPDFDAALKGILEQDPQAEIHLKETTRGQRLAVQARHARTLGAHAGRVRYLGGMPYDEFLNRMAVADAVLDPFHFGGCNSSAEAFAMGLPPVCLPGRMLGGRFTLGMYRELDMEQYVAHSPEDYVTAAVRLARDEDCRAHARATVTERAGALFERPDAGRQLGAALLRVVEGAG
ncbi:MAG TPA: tetratricopeptide repeat protein [Burkholderiales bacterium]|nr:tetratricopeptide repeat protein [Burkholderiales bacterium]